MTVPTTTLNDGRQIPKIGLGTYGLRGEAGIASMLAGIESGYRLLDTALNYKNEHEVGEAVRRSGVAREEFLVTTKLPGRHHGFDETLASFEESRANLGLDFVDLYLIHWPLPKVGKFVESWQAMIALREDGRVGSIGVSNFTEAHLAMLIEETDVTPAVNQVELHPNFPQAALREFHLAHGIATESWSPLAVSASITSNSIVTAVADAHGVTPTQAVIRWHLQLGAIPIPKSGDPERQRENLDVFGFELTEEEMASISSLESGRLWGADPDTHEEF
ncbi:MAG: 2,5-diketo-D-gluconate reductase [Microbacteriaceae bacterium]|jgi:diketogulonate reductase-like aldo/keto reductase|nr:2,5-diketo-D-gluconate reductase [Microbacteriaceae bacterium]